MTELVRTIITIVLFLGILGILVVIHELGHFVMARLFGVRVDEFGIGFPPRAKIIGVGRVDPADTAKYEADLATAAARRRATLTRTRSSSSAARQEGPSTPSTGCRSAAS